MGTNLGYLVLIGLGAMKLTELWKELTTRLGLWQNAWFKSAINLGICAVLVLFIQHRSVDTMVLIGAGAAGFSALCHSVDTVLRHHRDGMVSEVLGKARNRRH